MKADEKDTPYPANYEMDSLSDFNFGDQDANTDMSSSHYDGELVRSPPTRQRTRRDQLLPLTPRDIERHNSVRSAASSYNTYVPLPVPPLDPFGETNVSTNPVNPYRDYYRAGARGKSVKYSATPTYDPSIQYSPLANLAFSRSGPAETSGPRIGGAVPTLIAETIGTGAASFRANTDTTQENTGLVTTLDDEETRPFDALDFQRPPAIGKVRGSGKKPQIRYEEVELKGNYRGITALDRTLPPVPQENPFEAAPPLLTPPPPSDEDHGHQDKQKETPEERKLRKMNRNRLKLLRRKPRFHWTRLPYFTIVMTIIMVCVFIAELARMSELTGLAFQTKPYFNPMLGPSTYLLIHMGARYIPCMHPVEEITKDLTMQWPCPNSTTLETNVCGLAELCGLSGIPIKDNAYAPNQWYRIFTPIFLHAGFLHIIFNMLLQLTMGALIERHIGGIKYAIIYIALGIAGFLLGANFTPVLIALTGASGALFGIVACNFLAFVYCGRKNANMYETNHFWLFFVIMILEVVVSFVLGLLPGMDNFSHLGGFAMGIAMLVVLLNDPGWVFKDGIIVYDANATTIQQFKNNWNPFYNYSHKDPLKFWVWCVVRVVFLVLAILYFALLSKTFFTDDKDDTTSGCTWCKYFNCLPVNGWCDEGDVQIITSDIPNSSGMPSTTATPTNSITLLSLTTITEPAGTISKVTTTLLPTVIENGGLNNNGGLDQKREEFDVFSGQTTVVLVTTGVEPTFISHANVGLGLYALTAVLTFAFFKRKRLV